MLYFVTVLPHAGAFKQKDSLSNSCMVSFVRPHVLVAPLLTRPQSLTAAALEKGSVSAKKGLLERSSNRWYSYVLLRKASAAKPTAGKMQKF